MNGYMWFYAARAQAAGTRQASQPVRPDHRPEQRNSGRATALGLLGLVATIATTYAAVAG